eukprot:Opistho-2@4664
MPAPSNERAGSKQQGQSGQQSAQPKQEKGEKSGKDAARGGDKPKNAAAAAAAAAVKKNGTTPENNSPTPYDGGTPRSSTPDGAGMEADPIAEQLRREEIGLLLINREELNRRHAGNMGVVPAPPLKTQTVFVRKRRPKDVADSDPGQVGKIKHVTVARRIKSGTRVVKAAASAGADSLQFEKTVRYDLREGHIAQESIDPFSMLGSVNDFELEMRTRGEQRTGSSSPDRMSRVERSGRQSSASRRGGSEDVESATADGAFDKAARQVMDTLKSFDAADKTERRQKMAGMHIYERVDVVRDEHALETYRKQVASWRRQQNRIAGAVGRDPGKLMMNQGEEFRSMLEEKALLDRAITLLEKGSADFWRTSTVVGDELTGILSTLTRTERGEPPELEWLGKPGVVHFELGMEPSSSTSHPWKDSKYLSQRKRQLRKIVESLNPLQPDLRGLEVVGLAPILEELRRINAARIQATHDASLRAGADLDEESNKGESRAPGPHAHHRKGSQPSVKPGPRVSFNASRLAFECMAGMSETRPLVVVNDGTCAIHYSWARVRQECEFGRRTIEDGRQRFYFDANDGIILPGSTKSIPFVFKSERPGIFSETWRLTPSPMVGEALEVTLRGCALEHDTYGGHRAEIEWTLERRQIAIAMRELVESILDGVHGSDIAPSAHDEPCMPEASLIVSRNAELGIHCSGSTLSRLKAVAARAGLKIPSGGDAKSPGVWDYRIKSLHNAAAAIADDTEREEALVELNAVVREASFEPTRPLSDGAHGIGYDLLIQLADAVAETAGALRHKLGLPEKLFSVASEEDAKQLVSQPNDWLKKQGRRQSMANLSRAAVPEPPPAKGAKQPPAAPPGKGTTPTQAQPPAPPAAQQQQPPDAPAGHDDRPQSRVTKKVATRSNGKKDVVATSKTTEVPTPTAEPEKEKAVDRAVTATIYKDQLYNLVHGLVEDTVDKLASLCSELQE